MLTALQAGQRNSARQGKQIVVISGILFKSPDFAPRGISPSAQTVAASANDPKVTCRTQNN